ncbi:ABC transporter permease [Patescibacteria group bacterium]|nr:ABC transporter permease [Patescibacteria group bacterium]MBU1016398.1 ABC transporter permease [Patescibacteria group bacterium]MBU1685146.1 ABC transporter permease [Patescibacteria group bacterium]MBU1938803.1 ABC transporter permease [Patescibacteria group bacterium]
MRLFPQFKIAAGGLRTHKSRSALTILGIVIGIMAIIMVMAIGKGAEDLILDQIRGMGSRTLSVEPGRMPQGLSDFAEVYTESLKDREVTAIKNKNNVRGNNEVAPFVYMNGTISYQNEKMRTLIEGADQLWMDIMDVEPEEGAMFSDSDVKQMARVAVIGSNVKEELFGDSDAIGQRIKIKNINVKVIGVLPPTGVKMMMDVDDIVVMPYTTVQKILMGISHYHAILVEAETEELVPLIAEDIKITLREMHGITDPDKDDFHVGTMEDAMEIIGSVTSVLTLLLIAVAAISLLVGGIGIMNIMLVSVTERTREIGLRKAIGATKTDIITQFLIEAVILTILGGIIGIAIGAALTWVVGFGIREIGGFVSWRFFFPMSAVALGVGVAAAIGLIFGLYPARQAASKSPIEALRYE